MAGNKSLSHKYKGLIEKSFKLKVIGGVPLRGTEKVKHKCLICNKIFMAARQDMVQKIKTHKYGCPVCQKEKVSIPNMAATLKEKHRLGGIKKSNPVRYTTREYSEKVKLINIKPCEEFINMRTSMLHECLLCFHKFVNSPQNIVYQGNRCPICSGVKKKTLDGYKNELEELNISWIPLEYIGSRTPSLHACSHCGFEKVFAPTCVLQRKYKCPKCDKTRFKVANINGKEFLVEGFEALALKYIVKNKDIKARSIRTTQTGGTPTIKFKFDNKNRKHYPDIFIPEKNIVVEVKSTYTLGLSGKRKSMYRAKDFYKTCAKARAAIRKGYDYKLLLMSPDGTRIKLPKDWFNKTYREISSSVKKSSSGNKSLAKI